MQKYYWPECDAIVYEGTVASPQFWNKLWLKNDLKKEIVENSRDRLVLPETKSLLPADSRVLEGGCGTGKYVYALSHAGYQAYGIDTAAATLKKVHQLFPNLQLLVGDVNHLPFKDSYFAGYWSIGVIEHFFPNFDQVMAEMLRVIEPGGFLFLTFPYLSPLRWLKIALHRYPVKHPTRKPDNFYQFALSHAKVIDQFSQRGFTLVRTRSFDGFKGLREETGFPNISGKLRLLVSGLALPFAAHSILLVFKKNS